MDSETEFEYYPNVYRLPKNNDILDLIDFANGSPGLYIDNFKYWIDIPSSIKDQLNNKLTNHIEVLKLANEITKELSIEEQLWLINFHQN